MYLVLAGTGFDTPGPVTATIGGTTAQALYAGPQGAWPGLDQLNLLIPASLAGSGQVDVVMTAGGKVSNPVHITIQ